MDYRFHQRTVQCFGVADQLSTGADHLDSCGLGRDAAAEAAALGVTDFGDLRCTDNHFESNPLTLYRFL